MVDTVSYADPGSISPDKLVRILLGGLHTNIRTPVTSQWDCDFVKGNIRRSHVCTGIRYQFQKKKHVNR